MVNEWMTAVFSTAGEPVLNKLDTLTYVTYSIIGDLKKQKA